MEMARQHTLFSRLGGKAAVEAAVDSFYERLMLDTRINHFFEGVDMKRQRAKQKAFMTYAFGGAPDYAGASMRNAHEKAVNEQGLNDEHFDIVAGHLLDTLRDLNVGEAMCEEVMAIVGSTRDEVLNK